MTEFSFQIFVCKYVSHKSFCIHMSYTTPVHYLPVLENSSEKYSQKLPYRPIVTAGNSRVLGDHITWCSLWTAVIKIMEKGRQLASCL